MEPHGQCAGERAPWRLQAAAPRAAQAAWRVVRGAAGAAEKPPEPVVHRAAASMAATAVARCAAGLLAAPYPRGDRPGRGGAKLWQGRAFEVDPATAVW